MRSIQKDSLEIFKTNIYIRQDIGLVSNNAYLSVVATNKCNRNCPYCINSDTDHSLSIPVRKMTKNVGELVNRYGVKEAIILGGEPTLHPDICNIIHGLKYAGIEIVRLTTNGIALTDQLLKDMVTYGLYGLNLSFHNEDFITYERLSQIYKLCKELGIKLRINTNIWSDNHDTLYSFLDFYATIKNRCDEIRVSNIIPKDSFSVNPKNDEKAAQMILPDEEYNKFFQDLCDYYSNDMTLIENKDTLGFVRYILIPTRCPIIVNWNIGSKVAEQICENDIANRKINTFKCLVSGNISLSWNEGNTFIR